MDQSTIDLEDFTCSICREIFHNPVSLSCPHSYCQNCIIGLRKSSSTTTNAISSSRNDSFSHSTHLHQPTQCFVCAICRQESLGYVRYRELENRMSTLETSCPDCSMVLKISQLRRHSEGCLLNPTEQRRRKSEIINQSLSESQARALQKAQEGENRSTFQCPFCPRANFSLIHLRQHIKKRHKQEDQRRVCPICSTLPWGDKTLVSPNVYQHIKNRHRFDYDTFVNYEQDEEAMIREALQASLIDQ